MAEPKLYILAGDDWNGAFKGEMAVWKKRAREKGDVVIIQPDAEGSLNNALAQIKMPANIFLEAHGGKDGTFQWGKDSSFSYNELLDLLPNQGVQSVTIGGCYGNSALDFISTARVPAGTLVQSLVGSEVEGFGSLGLKLAKDVTARPSITPYSLLMEGLDSSSPTNVRQWTAYDEKRSVKSIDSDGVLARRIAVGGFGYRDWRGNPGASVVDLDNQLAELGQSFHERALPAESIAALTQEVETYFGTHDKPIVRSVITKMIKGSDPQKFNLEEKRVAYAFVVADILRPDAQKPVVAEIERYASRLESENLERIGINNERTLSSLEVRLPEVMRNAAFSGDFSSFASLDIRPYRHEGSAISGWISPDKQAQLSLKLDAQVSNSILNQYNNLTPQEQAKFVVGLQQAISRATESAGPDPVYHRDPYDGSEFEDYTRNPDQQRAADLKSILGLVSRSIEDTQSKSVLPTISAVKDVAKGLNI